MTAARVAEVLAKHRYRDVLGDYEIAPYYKHFGCSCGWEQNIAGMSGWRSWVAAHEAHVAAHVAAALVQAGLVGDGDAVVMVPIVRQPGVCEGCGRGTLGGVCAWCDCAKPVDAAEDPDQPPACPNHCEVQHRDRKPPWCNTCGWHHGRPEELPMKLRDTEGGASDGDGHDAR